MPKFTGMSEKSFFFLNLKYRRSMGIDAIALNFLKIVPMLNTVSLTVPCGFPFGEIRFLK